MKKVTWMLILSNAVLSLALANQLSSHIIKPQPTPDANPVEVIPSKPVDIHTNISIKTPEFLLYEDMVKQLNLWRQEAPELVEVETYGKSSKNKDLIYLRICKDKNANLPKVLITACIHGNEPWSTGCVMAYIGNLLADFETDPKIKELILKRDIYFIPVISPDSYPSSRQVNGVDPNRNFPTLKDPNRVSVTPIKELQNFFLKIKPNAVISGHTFGRMYLIPYGDQNQKTPNDQEYQDIVGRMSNMSNYNLKYCSKLYGTPIFGSEVDWYYRNGAFAIVAEFGSHQNKPTIKQIQEEFERTWASFKLFLEEAPLIEIKTTGGELNEFTQNAGIDLKYFDYQKRVVGSIPLN